MDIDIVLNPEENPKFMEIVNDFNNLLQEWNDINDAIFRIKKRFIYFWKEKKKLQRISRRLSDLQKRYLAHNNMAIEFAWHPMFRFPQGPSSELSFHLYHRLLLDRINQFRTDMLLIVANYNLVASELDHVRDFNITLSSFALSFLGLTITLIVLLIS